MLAFISDEEAERVISANNPIIDKRWVVKFQSRWALPARLGGRTWVRFWDAYGILVDAAGGDEFGDELHSDQMCCWRR